LISAQSFSPCRSACVCVCVCLDCMCWSLGNVLGVPEISLLPAKLVDLGIKANPELQA